MMKWTPSGDNHMATTWVGDTQVIYLIEKDTRLSAAQPDWWVLRKVSGAADPGGHVIGANHNVDKAKQIAEGDAERLQAQGF